MSPTVDCRCLVLDKRIKDFEFLKRRISKYFECTPLICGNSGLATFKDTNELPPIYSATTDYMTWRTKPNAYNAWKGHREIFRQFLETGKEYLFLLEDDALIIEEDMEKALRFIERNTFDMLYFGWYSNGHLGDVVDTEDDLKLRHFSGGAGFHGVLIKREIVDFLYGMLPLGPYDWIAGLIQKHSNVKAYAVYPAVIIQKDGHSYVEGHHLSKPSRYKE